MTFLSGDDIILSLDTLEGLHLNHVMRLNFTVNVVNVIRSTAQC